MSLRRVLEGQFRLLKKDHPEAALAMSAVSVAVVAATLSVMARSQVLEIILHTATAVFLGIAVLGFCLSLARARRP